MIFVSSNLLKCERRENFFTHLTKIQRNLDKTVKHTCKNLLAFSKMLNPCGLKHRVYSLLVPKTNFLQKQNTRFTVCSNRAQIASEVQTDAFFCTRT